MFKLAGDIFYFGAILGINAYLVFMLFLTQWRKNFLSIAWTMFFLIVAVILDLSATILFVHQLREFVITYVRTPLYLLLFASIWTLMGASIFSAIVGSKRRRGAVKVDVSPDKK